MFNFLKTLFDGSMKPNTDSPSNHSKTEYETILGYKRKFVSGDSLPAKIQRLGFVKSLLQMPTDKAFFVCGKTRNGKEVEFVTLAIYHGNPCIYYIYKIRGSLGSTDVDIIMSLDGEVLLVKNSFDVINNLQDFQLYEITDVSFYPELSPIGSHVKSRNMIMDALAKRELDPTSFI